MLMPSGDIHGELPTFFFRVRPPRGGLGQGLGEQPPYEALPEPSGLVSAPPPISLGRLYKSGRLINISLVGGSTWGLGSCSSQAPWGAVSPGRM